MARDKFKLNKVYLLEAMSDAGIQTWAELSRRTGIADCTVPNAFSYADGRVDLLTAERIAKALGVRVSSLGRRIINTMLYTPQETEMEEQKKEAEQKDQPLVNQLILRELKLQTELLKRLVEAWEK